jgi:hypothetical protein
VDVVPGGEAGNAEKFAVGACANKGPKCTVAHVAVSRKANLSDDVAALFSGR